MTVAVRRRRSEAPSAAGGDSAIDDSVVVEEPLEILLDGETLAVTMRTPGNDRELVLGFLWSEGIISSADDVTALAPCGRIGDPGRDNTMAVTLAPGARPPVDPTTGMLIRRGTIVSSACGVCGRRTLDDLFARFTRVDDATPVQALTLIEAVRALRERQPLFARTGGSHAATLVTYTGVHVATYEDVGRHNAVDKVVGSLVRTRTLGDPGRFLVVSGRASFEIVQKAMAAKIPVVASVSAPSSLAVELAHEAGMTLCGFVRGESMTIYAGHHRMI